eukprot:4292271-Pleurochrysis_carterae.AAC.1
MSVLAQQHRLLDDTQSAATDAAPKGRRRVLLVLKGVLGNTHVNEDRSGGAHSRQLKGFQRDRDRSGRLVVGQVAPVEVLLTRPHHRREETLAE